MRRVRYTTAAKLVQELLAAKRDLKLNALLKRLDGFEVLILDVLSYIPQDRSETDVLFAAQPDGHEQLGLLGRGSALQRLDDERDGDRSAGGANSE